MYNKLRLHAEILKGEFHVGACASYNSKFNFTVVYKTIGSVLMNDSFGKFASVSHENVTIYEISHEDFCRMFRLILIITNKLNAE